MLIAVRLWILLSTLLVGAGWILSAFHQLNRLGYGITFVLVMAGLGCYWQTRGFGGEEKLARTARKLWRRCRRPLPRLFLVLALLSLLAGALNLPNSTDSNSYRIPRVFHWLGQGQWHWIHTLDSRMNIAGTGFEWLSAPLILFTGSSQWLFLINWVSYLLIPGLVYSTFIRLGVRRRVAWWWMWLIASGWCYVFQAQTDINDSFAVVYALASVNFALRARRNNRVTDWWLALLAAALLTGVKQTCIPLTLVSLIALWPGLRTMLAQPVRTLLVVSVSLLISALPVTISNLWHTGNWMGLDTSRYGWSNTTLDSPFWGVIGNIFCLATQNLKPPIFPMDKSWNAAMQHFLQTPFGSHFKSFESFGYLDRNAEASLGIGLGLCVIGLVSVWRAHQLRPFRAPGLSLPQVDGLIRLLWLAPWLALLAFMAKVGTSASARQLAPYYVFFFPVFLAAAGHARVVRERWWQRLAVLVLTATVLLVAGSRSRPVFPAQTLLGWLHEKYPQSKPIDRVLAAFSSQKAVKIQQECFRADLPPGEKVIGYYSVLWGAAEPGLWQPWGVRRVERILPEDTLEHVRSLHIHYVVIDESALTLTRQTLPDWLRAYDAELVSQAAFSFHWGDAPTHLYLARLRAAPAN